jgi:hypothetical protein
MALHGIENFFVELVNSIIAAWQNRARLSRRFFDDPAKKGKAVFWATVSAVTLTLLCISLGGGVIYLILGIHAS